MDRLESLLKYMQLLITNNQFPDAKTYKRVNLVADEIEKELGIEEPKSGTGINVIH